MTWYIYLLSGVSVLAFGIIGNILVIVSILRQKSVLKNNYYLLVLHLAIFDLVALIFYVGEVVDKHGSDENIDFLCLGVKMGYLFWVGGIGIMLVISVFRYRATVHPLKPAITRKKVKVICGLVYIVGFILGYGASLPLCLISKKDAAIVYHNFLFGCITSCFYLSPTIFLAVIYYKIGQALVKQSKYIKNLCSNPVRRRSTPSSSLSIQRFIRNRKTFFVCVITVLCYGVGNVLISAWFIVHIAGEYNVIINHAWFWNLAIILRIAGSHAVNPLIYGILDKRLLKFWKLCRKKRHNQLQIK